MATFTFKIKINPSKFVWLASLVFALGADVRYATEGEEVVEEEDLDPDLVEEEVGKTNKGLIHNRCFTPKSNFLMALCRLLRSDLQAYTSNKEDLGEFNRPRVIIFFPNEEEAKEAIGKVRNALWGDFKLCALLPETGVNPLGAMEAFKYDETNVMLTTPGAARGLDFPKVTHVYNVGVNNDSVDYLHQSGRVGRVGQGGNAEGGNGGMVCSILGDDDDLDGERKADFDAMGVRLGISFFDVEVPAPNLTDDGDIEKTRKYLDDMSTLL